MLLLLILVVFGNQTSEIPYQKKFACDKGHKIENYSSDLKHTALAFAQTISGGNGNNKGDNQQPDPKDQEQKYMLWAAIAVAAINAVYVGVAILQWRAIKYQVRMSHRAQVAASPSGDPVTNLLHDADPHIHIDLTNVGHTTAYDCRYETWIELLPFPFTEFSTLADHVISEEPCVLYPNHKSMTINIPIRSGLTAEDRRDILDYRRHICLRVLVRYKDVFSWRKRWASFAFYVEPQGFAFLPKYNDAN